MTTRTPRRPKRTRRPRRPRPRQPGPLSAHHDHDDHYHIGICNESRFPHEADTLVHRDGCQLKARIVAAHHTPSAISRAQTRLESAANSEDERYSDSLYCRRARALKHVRFSYREKRSAVYQALFYRSLPCALRNACRCRISCYPPNSNPSSIRPVVTTSMEKPFARFREMPRTGVQELFIERILQASIMCQAAASSYA